MTVRWPLRAGATLVLLDVCNARWRRNYFSGFDGRSRGFQTPPLGGAVFLRRALYVQRAMAATAGAGGMSLRTDSTCENPAARMAPRSLASHAAVSASVAPRHIG